MDVFAFFREWERPWTLPGPPFQGAYNRDRKRLSQYCGGAARAHVWEHHILSCREGLGRKSGEQSGFGDFVRREAVEAAEADVFNRTIVTIPAKDWEAFEAWANRPPEEIAGLKDLARKAPTWQK
jgi:hypothetical protein